MLSFRKRERTFISPITVSDLILGVGWTGFHVFRNLMAVGCLLGSLNGLAQSQSMKNRISELSLNNAEISMLMAFVKQSSGNSIATSQKNENASALFLMKAEDLFSQFKSRLILKTESLEKNICVNSLDSKIGVDNQEKGLFKIFVDDLVNIESSRCLENQKNKSVQQIAEIVLSDNFQLKAFENLNFSNTTSDFSRTCQKTSVPLIGNSRYCFNNLIEIEGDTALIVSIADSSENDNTAPIYLRWSGMLIQKKSDDKILMYSLAYGRGPTIPFKPIAKQIMNSQESKYTVTLTNWAL